MTGEADAPDSSLSRRPCDCWRCLERRGERIWFMVVCAECGNKRCPHAADHDLACTASNAVGQPGSAYEHGSGAASSRRASTLLGTAAADVATQPHPCGHLVTEPGCGGCDPAAIDFVLDDDGSPRAFDPALDLANGPSRSVIYNDGTPPRACDHGNHTQRRPIHPGTLMLRVKAAAEVRRRHEFHFMPETGCPLCRDAGGAS